MSIQNENDVSIIDSTKEDSINNLFGLTSEVETEIKFCIKNNHKKRLLFLFDLLHPADQADMLERLSKDQLDNCLRLLSKRLDPETLVYLEETVQEDVIKGIGPNAIAKALPELNTDDEVEILENLQEDQRDTIIKKLPKADRILVEEAFTYPENSAGRLMQREFLSFPDYWTVGQTIDHMRNKEFVEDENFYSIFIIDPGQRLLGILSLSKLLSNKRSIRLKDIMNNNFQSVDVERDQEEIALLFQQYALVDLAVTDKADRIIGVIIFDDIVDVIKEEAEEDFFGLGGVSDGSIRTSIFKTLKDRFSWLSVNLVTAIIASMVIGLFQEEIEKIVALAVLMPIVASMGGNAGTQTVTVAVRALATRQLSYINLQKFVLRESWVGMFNGVLFAIFSSILAYFWFNDFQLALIISISMVLTMIVAGLFGILIPVTLKKMNIDPAISSSVFVTTITDVIGFVSFLGVGAYFL